MKPDTAVGFIWLWMQGGVILVKKKEEGGKDEEEEEEAWTLWQSEKEKRS